MAEVEQLGVAT